MRTKPRDVASPPDASPVSAGALGLLRAVLGHPAAVVGAVALIVLLMSWQFITDAARAVPAFDTAFYQWRVEFLLNQPPGELIELRGATGALAGGYRVAQPVLGALMRTVGGVAAPVPTVVLSVMLRILAAVGVAAFAWQHRRNTLLFYVTLFSVPALFLLQQFFGFMDNFLTLALLAGVLLLLHPMRTSWLARGLAVALMLLAGLSHPTSLAIFLLSMGVLAGYRLIRDRSFASPLRSEGPVLFAGAAAVALTAAFWLGGLWGPSTSFSDAAVPPPETLGYFVNRSLNVLRGMTPILLIPLTLLGLGALFVRMWRDREYFSEVVVAWSLPLAGMFGFLIGAAYPYFRFYNATLAPLLLAAVGLTVLMQIAVGARWRPLAYGLPVVALVVIAGTLALWLSWGLSDWNSKPTWLTPEIRETNAAASGYLEAEPPERKAIFIVDAQPGTIVPYGKYKEFANAVYAGLEGDRIDDVALYFGRVEDFRAGRASRTEDEPYNEIAAETSRDALRLIDREPGNVAVFLPAVMNEQSDNADAVRGCPETTCIPLSESGLHLMADLSTAPVSRQAVEAARSEAEEARRFAERPPGPGDGLARSLLAVLRLALLFGLPGLLLWLGLPTRSFVEAVALIPLLSVAAITVVGVVLEAIIRRPFSPAVGWTVFGISLLVGLAGWALGRREPVPPPVS